MNAERWAQIKAVFHAAAALPANERAEYIRSRCGGDEELAVEIQALLEAQDQNESFIESPALQSIGQAPLDSGYQDAGKLIGSYRVVRKIGSGGMGSVYLAERADQQFEKQVAIKLIRQGLGEDFIVQRFVSERQMLGRLEHRNIARLIDGGTTVEGLPYLVMEYVEGRPITEYCSDKMLSTTERLKLFRLVCAAVHHAHQHLIVHRDIKPGNILVTPDGEPKLLDFGIAKLLSPDGGDGQTTTLFGRMMTPDYASPEQAKGEPITTASDIYSLGVLLYELLTGLRPYRITSNSPLEIAQVICEREPTKPSSAVGQSQIATAAGSGSTNSPGELARGAAQLGKLRRRLEGDLDNIILKAMSKEPKRRYASAQEFSEDIRRHIEGLPVSARPATLSYRASKFVRRHKMGVTATLVILVLLVTGVAGIARQSIVARRQRARAEKRFNEVRKLANEFMFKFHDSIAGLPGTTEARRLVVSESLQYLNSLVDDASDDQSLQGELATAYFRLGDIQGMSTSGNLGDTKGALESHRKALSLRQTLAAARSDDSDLQLLLASSYDRVGYLLHSTGDDKAGLEHLRKSIEISEALLESGASGLPARRTLAFAQHGLAQVIPRSDPSGALDYYKKAIAGHEAVLIESPSDSQVRRNLSLLYKNTGGLIHWQGDKDTALTLYHKALTIDQADLAANPNETEFRMALSFSYGSIGSALVDKGDLAGGLDNYQRALDLRISVAKADPKNAFARDSVARAYDRIGGILLRMGDTKGALSSYRKMLETSRSPSALPLQIAVCARMADSYSRFASHSEASSMSEEKALAEAIRWYRGSVDLLVRAGDELSETQAKEKDRITQELARCEAALDTAKKPLHTH